MLTRFELFVVLRNQVRDRAMVRRSLAVEAAMEELAALAGADPARWGLCGLGANIDAELVARNEGRRGEVAEEILLTEGVEPELARAARTRRRLPPQELSPLEAALAGAEGLVDEVYALLSLDETLDTIDPAAIAHRLRRAADRRGDEAARRVLDCLARVGLELDDAARAVVSAMRRVREDLRL